MKKVFSLLFLFLSLTIMAANTPTALDKEVQGVNKEQLEFKELKTKKILLENQNVNSGAIKVTNDDYQNQQQKIKVSQGEKSTLESELSEGVEEKSFFKYILGGIAVVALIIAL